MRLSRRKLLFGVGAVAIGSGLVTGSSAISTVQGERTVSVSTTGDGAAAIGLVGNDDDIASQENLNGNSVFTLENTQINERSRTDFLDAFTVTNNTTTDLTFHVDPTTVQAQDSGGNSVNVIDFRVGGTSIVGQSNSINLNAGTNEDVTIIIDLLADGIDGSDLASISSVTFVANEQ